MNTQEIRRTLGVALLLVLPPALGAQAPKVYFACYVPSSGTVYRIKEPSSPQVCGSSTRKGVTEQHIEFSWTDGAGAVRITDAAGGDLSGAFGSPSVARLLGRALSATPPTDGQVLTWNQAANAWEPRAVPPGGASDHGALSGLGDDDHPQYMLANGVRVSLNGFAVTGTTGVGSIPINGPGARLMWYPRKSAFRAGYVNSAQWDDNNIGYASVAIGNSVLASGANSVALGGGSRATGTGSAALLGGHASADGALAIGGTATAPLAKAIGWNVEASGDASTALGWFASTNGKRGAFVYGDASSPDLSVNAVIDNQFVVRAAHFWLGSTSNATATAGRYIETSTGAFLSSGGTWTNSSDSTKKTGFRDIDGDSLLARLASMPVRTWRYRAEDSTVRHMGPTAQEFRAAFSLGDSDKAIATVDADGVSLAAIQALVKRTERLARENDALQRTNTELRSELGALEERMGRIEAQLAQLAARGSDAAVRR
jgi:hypothetical protein